MTCAGERAQKPGRTQPILTLVTQLKGVRKILQVQYQARSREVLQQAFEETVSYQTLCVREWSNDKARVSADCIVKATYGDADVTLTARRLLESRGWLQAAKKLAKKKETAA